MRAALLDKVIQAILKRSLLLSAREKVLLVFLAIITVRLIGSPYWSLSVAAWALYYFVERAYSLKKTSASGERKRGGHRTSTQYMSEDTASSLAKEVAFDLTYSLSRHTRILIQRFAPRSYNARCYMRAYVELLLLCMCVVERRVCGQLNSKAKNAYRSTLVSTVYQQLSRQLKANDISGEAKLSELFALRERQYERYEPNISSQSNLGLLPEALLGNLQASLQFLPKEERMIPFLRQMCLDSISRCIRTRGKR